MEDRRKQLGNKIELINVGRGDVHFTDQIVCLQIKCFQVGDL